MTLRKSSWSSGLVLALIFVCAPRSLAHSFPELETPAAGASLNQSPGNVTIKYDAPIEKLFASLQVLNSEGQNQATGEPEVSSDGSTLSVPVKMLPPGEYTVQWSVVCIDTHHTQGSYSFTVEKPHA